MKERLLEFIKRWEGCKLTKYQDIGGKWTIGIGHLIKEGEDVPDTITQERADDILWLDLQKAIKAVKDLVKVPINQNQMIALISFTFNCGTGSLQHSTLLMQLNRKAYQQAADSFLKYKFVSGHSIPGLLRRRESERKLFMSQPDIK